MGKKEKADMSGEEYLKGRRAGVEGTYGMERKGVAEKTVLPGEPHSDGGGEGDLAESAGSLYDRAVAPEWDTSGIGDKALTER
jgi:hypothetical protein